MMKMIKRIKQESLGVSYKIHKTLREHPFAVVFSFLIIALVLYFLNFSERVSHDNADWGTFGDFINGLLHR
jgi:hypothetical protein